MPLIRKRRTAVASDDEEDNRSPSPPPTTQRRKNRRTREEDDDEDDIDETVLDEADGEAAHDGASKEQMVKKLVRLALACEYARIPIRRTEISAKILTHHARSFKEVFNQAQKVLRNVFGMEMVELPVKEKVTIAQRRAAQKAEKPTGNSNQWVLTSVLPAGYKNSTTILAPPKVPNTDTESTYVGIYSFIISIIALCGGVIPEVKLERYLKRTNLDEYTPVGQMNKEKLLGRLVKEGYIMRVKEMNNGDEEVNYYIGPRGKVEVGTEAVAGMVKTVYGDGVADIDARLKRSLGGQDKSRPRTQTVTAEPQAEGARRSTRRRRDEDLDDEDD